MPEYKSIAELESAIKAAEKEVFEAGKAKVPITRAQGKRYDQAIAKVKRLKAALGAAKKLDEGAVEAVSKGVKEADE